MATRFESASPGAGVWKIAQFFGIILTVVLLAGLLRAPELTLKILWNAVIPILPAAFLIQPEIWRNACPLATLNVLSGRRAGKRSIGPDAARRFGAVGIVLLFVMVPARRFLFNTDGTALAVTIIAVAVLALILGFVFDMKAGFCNALCPVLPVERLYGQRPLLGVPNAHCAPCTLCTRRGCIDLVKTKSVEQTLGAESRPGGWLLTPYGAFAAAFPGFVIGYYTTTDVALSAAGSIYLDVGLWMLGSFVVVAILTLAFRIPGAVATIPIAGLSLGLYYWFAAPVVTEALVLAEWAPTAIRAAALLLLAVWLWQARISLNTSNGAAR
jgi:nitrite reductase (NADH) large subunit